LFSCDLLSKFISLIFWYNNKTNLTLEDKVVICFQNLYLWYSDTTDQFDLINSNGLWFAFKIYIFDILIQPNEQNLLITIVVICFQNLYLWYSDTTFFLFDLYFHKLWFAFKIYIFDILIQLALACEVSLKRCDLLSKFISLIFWYNNSCSTYNC